MFFDDVYGLQRVAVAALVAYVAIIAILRIAGKRSLSKLNVFDFVVTIALGSVLASVILSRSVALLEGVLAFIMLVCLQWLVARLAVIWPAFRRATRSQPRLLLRDGRLLERAMADERITPADISSALRRKGIGRLEDAGAVVLETDGTLSVLGGPASEITLLEGVRH